MKATEDFSPISPDEAEIIALDFTTYLAPGETAAALLGSGWTCTVAEQSLVPDPSPASRLIGSAALDTATNIVSQKVGNLVSGATYVMEAAILTTGGETLSIWAFLDCIPVGQG